jgi:hypothetical protein
MVMSTPKRLFDGIYPQFQAGNATPFAEKGTNETPRYAFGRDRNKAERILFIPWANPNESIVDPRTVIWKAAQDFLGYSFVKTVGANKYISRATPAFHPDFTAANNVGTQDIIKLFEVDDITRMEGTVEQGQDGNLVGQHYEAKVGLSYSSLPYVTMADGDLQKVVTTGFPDESTLWRYVSCHLETSTVWHKFRQLSALRWFDGTPLTQTTSFSEFKGDLYVTWHQIPVEAVPMTAIRALTKKTNIADFGLIVAPGGVPIVSKYPGLYGSPIIGYYKAQTLTFESPKFEKAYRMSNGKFATDITYHFEWSPYGSNSFPRAFAPLFFSGITWGGGTDANGDYIVTTVVGIGNSLHTGDWIAIFTTTKILGQFQITVRTPTTFVLNDSHAFPVASLNTATLCTAVPGVYPAGYIAPNGTLVGQLVPVGDFSKLFQPEP